MCLAMIDSRVRGIPCKIRIDHYRRVRGSFRRDAPSDMDYYGYTEMSWEVCDSRGRPAPWLAKKMTRKDDLLVEESVSVHMESWHESRNCCRQPH